MADFWRKGLRAMIDSKAYNFLPDLAGKSDELEAMLTSLTEEFCFSTSEQAWAMLFVCLGIENIKSFLKNGKPAMISNALWSSW